MQPSTLFSWENSRSKASNDFYALIVWLDAQDVIINVIRIVINVTCIELSCTGVEDMSLAAKKATQSKKKIFEYIKRNIESIHSSLTAPEQGAAASDPDAMEAIKRFTVELFSHTMSEYDSQ